MRRFAWMCTASRPAWPGYASWYAWLLVNGPLPLRLTHCLTLQHQLLQLLPVLYMSCLLLVLPSQSKALHAMLVPISWSLRCEHGSALSLLAGMAA